MDGGSQCVLRGAVSTTCWRRCATLGPRRGAAPHRLRREQPRQDALSGVPRRRAAGGFGRRERRRHRGWPPQAPRHALERRPPCEPDAGLAVSVARRPLGGFFQARSRAAAPRRLSRRGCEQICRVPSCTPCTPYTVLVFALSIWNEAVPRTSRPPKQRHDRPAATRRVAATVEQRLHRELVQLHRRFSRPEHGDRLTAKLTDILRRLEGSRHADSRMMIRILKEILDGLDELESEVSALLGPPWLTSVPPPKRLADEPSPLSGSNPCGSAPPQGTLLMRLRELTRSSIGVAPRRLRKMTPHLTDIQKALRDELQSRLRLTLDVEERRLVRAKEQYCVLREQMAASWWQHAARRIMDSWISERPKVTFSPHLTVDDRTLADLWGRPRRKDQSRDRKMRYAARRAERSAALFYQQFDLDVRDVSIGQLTRSEDIWKTCDLLVDKSPIDVKNVRGRGAFGGYVLKSPKQYHDQEVRICGVVTDYHDDFAQGGYDSRGNYRSSSSQTVLGETSKWRPRGGRESRQRAGERVECAVGRRTDGWLATRSRSMAP